MHTYLDAKLRSFWSFFSLLFLRTWKFTRRLAAGFRLFLGLIYSVLLTCFSGKPFRFSSCTFTKLTHVPLAYIYVGVFPLDLVLNWSVGLKCLNYRFAVPHSVGLHGRLSWFYVLELLHWAVFFPKKLGAVRFAGYCRAASKSRRTKSRITTKLWIGSKKVRLRPTLGFAKTEVLVVLAFLEPAKNRSTTLPLRERKRSNGIPRCWIDASYQFFHSIKDFGSIPVCSIAEDNLVSQF